MEDTNIENRVDYYLAYENRWLSEKGTDAAITGLFDELLKDKRFETVILLDSVPEAMKNFESESNAISWDVLESLCRDNDVEAIFSLAYYEADTKVSLKKTSVLQSDLMRQKVKIKGQEITLETLIENGWRIYDPFNRRVIDEIVFNDRIVSKGKGVDPVEAYKSIENRREDMLSKSRTTGSNYGLRLLPSENKVLRSFYVNGTENFVKAGELVFSGDWQGATDLWELERENEDSKMRGRSCHNLAVMYEREENLEKALQLATKALENHKSKVTSAYVKALEQRIESKSRLEQQLAQTEFAK